MDASELKKLFGLKVKTYRIKKKLSQEKLSEMIDRTQRQVSLIELGKSFPSPETISELASVLECEIADLFTFKEQKNTEDMKKELYQSIESMSDDEVKTLYLISKNM